jgi:phosphatidylethanolamine/phosphatidyl-N-methylethanolamine N-methyltransferase
MITPLQPDDGRAKQGTSVTGISIENVTKTYKLYAPLYDFVFGAILEPGRRLMAERVSALKPDSILEVGVGTGLILERYPSASAITGIDVCTEMLKIARQRASRLAEHRIELFSMDAERMSFDSNRFDCVTLPYVLSVTPDPDALVREARRVCRKGGTLFVLNHFSGSKFWWLLERAVESFAKRIGFRSTFTYDEQILRHEWKILSVEDVNLFGLSKLIAIRN